MKLFTTLVLLGASVASLATEGGSIRVETVFSSIQGLPANSLEIISKENKKWKINQYQTI